MTMVSVIISLTVCGYKGPILNIISSGGMLKSNTLLQGMMMQIQVKKDYIAALIICNSIIWNPFYGDFV